MHTRLLKSVIKFMSTAVTLIGLPAMANAHITDRAVLIARAAVELHGGLGFTWECDVQIFFKRAMFNRAFLGTPEVQRERCAKLADW